METKKNNIIYPCCKKCEIYLDYKDSYQCSNGDCPCHKAQPIEEVSKCCSLCEPNTLEKKAGLDNCRITMCGCHFHSPHQEVNGEAHETEDGYCCACGYDIAKFQKVKIEHCSEPKCPECDLVAYERGRTDERNKIIELTLKEFDSFLLKDWSGEAEVEAEIERLKQQIIHTLK